jgi:hypothetical protein
MNLLHLTLICFASSSAVVRPLQSNPSRGKSNMIYKKVAVVENFFQIIYTVHVEMEGKAGKHAGQKRTYKAVSHLIDFQSVPISN